jgi:hypothetical protein
MRDRANVATATPILGAAGGSGRHRRPYRKCDCLIDVLKWSIDSESAARKGRRISVWPDLTLIRAPPFCSCCYSCVGFRTEVFRYTFRFTSLRCELLRVGKHQGRLQVKRRVTIKTFNGDDFAEIRSFLESQKARWTTRVQHLNKVESQSGLNVEGDFLQLFIL